MHISFYLTPKKFREACDEMFLCSELSMLAPSIILNRDEALNQYNKLVVHKLEDFPRIEFTNLTADQLKKINSVCKTIEEISHESLDFPIIEEINLPFAGKLIKMSGPMIIEVENATTLEEDEKTKLELKYDLILYLQNCFYLRKGLAPSPFEDDSPFLLSIENYEALFDFDHELYDEQFPGLTDCYLNWRNKIFEQFPELNLLPLFEIAEKLITQKSLKDEIRETRVLTNSYREGFRYGFFDFDPNIKRHVEFITSDTTFNHMNIEQEEIQNSINTLKQQKRKLEKEVDEKESNIKKIRKLN